MGKTYKPLTLYELVDIMERCSERYEGLIEIKDEFYKVAAYWDNEMLFIKLASPFSPRYPEDIKNIK